MSSYRHEEKIENLLKGRILARVHAEESSNVLGGLKTNNCGPGCEFIVPEEPDPSSPLSEAATSESLPDS